MSINSTLSFLQSACCGANLVVGQQVIEQHVPLCLPIVRAYTQVLEELKEVEVEEDHSDVEGPVKEVVIELLWV